MYDYAWFPAMDSDLPETCAFASVCKHHPIHLWDAYESQRLRATYDVADERTMEPTWAISCVLTAAGRVYAGAKDVVRMWELERPGKQLKSWKMPKLGIAACFVVQEEVVVVGFYSGKVVGMQENGKPTFTVNAHKRGVTRVKFSPCGQYLFAGGRMGDDVLAWDIRRLTEEPLWRVPRHARTNQRIDFDVVMSDVFGIVMGTGHSDRDVASFWSVRGSSPSLLGELCPHEATGGPVVNGVSFFRQSEKPKSLFVALATGQRAKHTIASDSSCDEDNCQIKSIVEIKPPQPSPSISTWEIKNI